MKKFCFLFCLCLLVPALADAQDTPAPQSLMQHAIELGKLTQTQEGQFFFEPTEDAFKRFRAALAQPGDTALSQILDRLKDNPFLGGSSSGNPHRVFFLDEFVTNLKVDRMTRSYSTPATSSGGFSPTALADGLAKFLVARTKEELSIAFFRQFREDLQRDKRLGNLFPGTTAVLTTIGEQIYQFDLYLESMRQAFQKDMKVLPANTKLYLQDNAIIPSPRLQILAEDALELSQALLDGMSPDSVINYFATEAAVQQAYRLEEVPAGKERDQLTDLAGGLRSLGLLSESLRDGSGERIWLTEKQIGASLRDEATLYIYLGLLWQQTEADGIRFSNGNNLRGQLGALASNAARLAEFRNCLRDFTRQGLELASALKAERRASAGGEKEARYERFYRFFDPFFKMLQTSVRFKINVAGMLGESCAADSVVFKGLQHLNELNYDISQQRYAASVNDLIYVLELFLPKGQFGFRDKLFKYGHFIAAVAEAESSDQVAAAIEAVALPPGSSRVKKQNHFSAALNAYTGLVAGRETLQDVGEETFAGVSAPLGFTFSWKFKDKRDAQGNVRKNRKGKERTPGSFSIYTPLVDVGALVAFRFNDPNASDLPELQWNNLLAPGAYAVFGLPNNLPISLGFGAQRGPNLRAINNAATPDLKSTKGWRWGAFISVDIPLFNLYVQPKGGD
jgi:hypothetical protein